MKKLARKLLAVVAAMTLVMAMGVTAFAANTTPAKGGTVAYSGTDPAPAGGSITITNTAAGHTYKLYRLFEAKSGSESDSAGITYSGPIPSSLSQYFQPNTDTGTIEVTTAGKDAATGELSSDAAKALINWAASANALASAIADKSGTLEFMNLPYGYYVVTSDLKQGGAVSVTSTNKHGEVHEKNNSDGGNDTKKEIVTGTTTDEKTGITTNTTAFMSSAKIGDTVKYQIIFTAVNYDSTNTAQKQYQVIDTNSGIDIKKNTIVVKVGETKLDSSAYIVSDGTTPLTITIPWANTTTAADGTVTVNFKYDAPTTVTITYDAELTATTGSNNAQVNGKGPKPETTVYTTGFDLTKIDGSTRTALKGAKFELYEGTPTNVTKDNDGNITAVNGTESLTKLNVSEDTANTKGAYTVDTDGTATIEVNDNGKLTIKGLKANTNYYLKEIQAPDGYTLPTTLFSLTTGEAGKDVSLKTGDLVNTKGSELPSTGGMGTTIFYVLGAALVIGAGVVLVTRKRLSR